MAGDEAERLERFKQRRQHGHDVIHHGLAHRTPPPEHDPKKVENRFSETIMLKQKKNARACFNSVESGSSGQCSRGPLSSLARSIEVSTTSKVTPSWYTVSGTSTPAAPSAQSFR